MDGMWIVTFLAALGLLSLLWAAVGWLLPVWRCQWILCPGETGKLGFLWMHRWLESLGLVKGTLILLDLGLDPESRRALEKQGMEICSPEELLRRLGLGVEAN